jgi:hypothetical protein
MTSQPHIISAQEFLHLREATVDNTDLLEKFDDQLRDMCTQQPDETAQIFEVLAVSARINAREATAIYARYLLGGPRGETAVRLLRGLAHDPDEHIRSTAEDTVTTATNAGSISMIDAAGVLSHHHRRSKALTRNPMIDVS